jgi:hypothetical protein
MVPKMLVTLDAFASRVATIVNGIRGLNSLLLTSLMVPKMLVTLLLEKRSSRRDLRVPVLSLLAHVAHVAGLHALVHFHVNLCMHGVAYMAWVQPELGCYQHFLAKCSYPLLVLKRSWSSCSPRGSRLEHSLLFQLPAPVDCLAATESQRFGFPRLARSPRRSRLRAYGLTQRLATPLLLSPSVNILSM